MRSAHFIDADRMLSDADWAVCRVEAGSCNSPDELSLRPLDWLPAACPGTVAGALRALGRPYCDPGLELDAADWWYRARFALQPSELPKRWQLHCEGLATLADLWMNGELMGSTANMHVAHRFPIDGPLAAHNELLIRFQSVDAFLRVRRPRPRWRVPMLVQQQLRFVRTTLLGRTPGWSPPCPPIGPWRTMTLEAVDTLRVLDVRLTSVLVNGAGVVDFSGTLGGNAKATATLHLDGPHGRWSAPVKQHGSRLQATLNVPSPELWWPHTHGSPVRYTATLDINNHASGARSTEVRLGNVGFRTIRVDGTDGRFRLLVNEVPVFCRGACWTPLDVITLSASAEAYSAALRQAADAGLNMIRVGGTMTYEADAFYEAASALGILVWQDFMFANMDYPEGDPIFDQTVRAETQALIARIGGQPSLVVLCGNSEGGQQAAMWGAPRDFWLPALYHVTLHALCKELCPSVPYWPSSTHGGAFPHQPSAGTSSYYGVGAYMRPLEDARRAELSFATECLAFANVPEPSSLATLNDGKPLPVHSPTWKARSPRDLGAGWDFDDVRDHYLKRLYGVDPVALRYADNERYLALSRVVTADVMTEAFAEWRREGSKCGGALVWFLKDLWAGAGWGLIAADGTPKAPWYALRRILQSRVVFFTDEGVNGLNLHVVNERAAPLTGRVDIGLYADGAVPLRGTAIPVSVPGHSQSMFAVAGYLDEFMDLTYSYRFGPPTANVVVATLVGHDDVQLSQAFHLPSGALVEPRDPGLAASAFDRGDGRIELQVTNRTFARSIRIEVEDGIPSDNYFHLAPGATRRIEVARSHGGARKSGSITALNSIEPTRIVWLTDLP